MQLITTISQKGQVVVPKKVRDQLGLSILDRLTVKAENGKIIMSPISKTNEVFGMFKPKGVITQSEIKASHIVILDSGA